MTFPFTVSPGLLDSLSNEELDARVSALVAATEWIDEKLRVFDYGTYQASEHLTPAAKAYLIQISAGLEAESRRIRYVRFYRRTLPYKPEVAS